MSPPTARHRGDMVVDVAVAGGGLAGLATATHLARCGARVLCVEHRSWPRAAVGESLEFSAPRLLAELGVELTGSYEQGHLFPKTSVRVVGGDDEFTVWPPPWFARPPIWCSRLAFHTDRTELDQRLLQLATDAGVEMLPERVTGVEHDRDTIIALTTDEATRIRARWFIDATGHTCRLFGRALDLDRELLGDPRTAYWTRIGEPPRDHATSLYFPDPAAQDLTWAWEIPLNDSEISIGLVMSATRLGVLRSGGAQPHQIFEQELAAIPRLRRVIREQPRLDLCSTSYAPYRHRRPMGPNWLLVGDASGMADPLTSNGVTSALRHADLAARTVSHALAHGEVGRRRAWAYRNTAPPMIATVGGAMETFVYEPRVRRRLGLRPAVNLYAATSVVTNSWYARIDPTTVSRALACRVVQAVSTIWTRIASRTIRWLARLGRPVRHQAPPTKRLPGRSSGESAPPELSRSRPARGLGRTVS